MIKRMLLRWAIGILSVIITVWVIKQIGAALDAPGLWKLKWPGFWNIVAFVPVLAVVNAVVGPILRVSSLPFTCLTFGLFGLVINAFMFWIAGTATGAEMTFLTALCGPILLTLIATPFSWIIKEKD